MSWLQMMYFDAFRIIVIPFGSVALKPSGPLRTLGPPMKVFGRIEGRIRRTEAGEVEAFGDAQQSDDPNQTIRTVVNSDAAEGRPRLICQLLPGAQDKHSRPAGDSVILASLDHIELRLHKPEHRRRPRLVFALSDSPV